MLVRPVAFVVVGMLALGAACGDDGPPTVTERPAATTTTVGLAPGDARAPGDTSGTTARPSGTTSAGASAGADADWPAPKPVTHGGQAWSVYLAVERETPAGADTPKLRQAMTDAETAGYDPSSGEVDCDRGAREAFKLDPARRYFGVAVYFASEADARRFVALYEPGVVGVALVETLCAD